MLAGIAIFWLFINLILSCLETTIILPPPLNDIISFKFQTTAGRDGHFRLPNTFYEGITFGISTENAFARHVSSMHLPEKIETNLITNLAKDGSEKTSTAGSSSYEPTSNIYTSQVGPKLLGIFS